ncbi:MAG: hypothetical protein D6731_02865 [Planctomycetota bacterium]|nr:MAG: hypothetical protein D6731_02865 [Planctomycetota bacterium]
MLPPSLRARARATALACLSLAAAAYAQDAPSPAPPSPETVARLKERLSVQHVLKPGNVLGFSYPFSDPAELNDWQAKGLDVVDVREVQGGGGRKSFGLELGAGSRGAGVARHSIALDGTRDFELEFEVWAAHNSPSAIFCLLLSKKVGLAWGQTICKPKSLRPYNKRAAPDPTLFREERVVRIRVRWEDNVLTVTTNGRKTDTRSFKKGELKSVRIGFLVRNARMVIESLTVEGTLDPKSLR